MTLTPTQKTTSAYIALLITSICISFSAIFVTWAEAPPVVISFYRMGIATALMLLPWLNHIRTRRWSWTGVGFALLAGAFFAGDTSLWSVGVKMNGATIPSVLANTAPLWVGLGTVYIFKQKLGRLFWSGVGMAILGTILIIGTDSLRSAELGIGALFGLGAGIFYAGYFLVTQKGREHLDVFSYFVPAAFGSTVILALIILLMGDSFVGYTNQTYQVLVLYSIVSQVIGYLCMTYALGILPASIVSAVVLIQPLLSAFWAMWLLDQYLTVWQSVAGVLVLAGIFLVHRGRNTNT
jgi:drug/metabolite transporter (DMT)-like permease